MGWLSFFGSLINTGGNVAVGVLNKDAYQKQAEAAALKAELELEKTRQKNRIITVIAFFVVGIILILFLRKKK